MNNKATAMPDDTPPPPAAALKPRPARKPAASRPAAGKTSATRQARAEADRALRPLLQDCRRLLSEDGEANGPAIARAILARLEPLLETPRHPLLDRFFEHLARDFSPDPKKVLAAAVAYANAPQTAEPLLQLARVTEPPRQELLRRINRAPGGCAALVRLRRALLERLPRQRGLAVVEHDLLHLLSSWFNPGFLQLQRVDWNSPAQLLEQIIRHEAVHEIDGWDDLRRRLQPDRRCFAFFHPQLPHEPLIFVEVALVDAMAEAIAPLIDKKAAPRPPEAAKVAVFYSISNCQPGLRGVSLGNFLIKRVAGELKREFPQLSTFCTLSPIPGLMHWLHSARDPAQVGRALVGLPQGVTERAVHALATLREAAGDDLAGLGQLATLQALPAPAQQALKRLATIYLTHVTPQPLGDPVARFHLDNGARLERLNALANLAPKGLKQSAGLMVNYLYDLQHIERRHQRFVRGEVVQARAIQSLI